MWMRRRHAAGSHRRAHGHDGDVVAYLGVGADEACDGEDLEVEQQTERSEALPREARP
jgi:hypothetical protein